MLSAEFLSKAIRSTHNIIYVFVEKKYQSFRVEYSTLSVTMYSDNLA